MRARVLRDFNDLKEGVVRRKGDVFEVDEERFAQINATKHGKLVEKAPKAKKTEE